MPPINTLGYETGMIHLVTAYEKIEKNLRNKKLKEKIKPL